MKEVSWLLYEKPRFKFTVDFPESIYRIRKRRNSNPMTKIEKHMKVHHEYVEYDLLSSIERKKIYKIRKPLISK